MPTEIKSGFFQDKNVIFSPTFHDRPAVELFLKSLFQMLDHRRDVVLVIMDNDSIEDVKPLIKSIDHPQIITVFREQNLGKARATNEFIAEYFDRNALPRTVWSVDPDIMIDPLSFDFLSEAILNMPDNIKVLGPRYKRNECNPEMNTFLPPRNIKGKNGKTYSIVFPFFCCVAGPVLTMTGETMRDLFNFRFFPTDNYQPYGNDDTAIYLELKKRGLKSGYLNGTLANHLRSGDNRAVEVRRLSINS